MESHCTRFGLSRWSKILAVSWIAWTLTAAEYRGVVKSNGLAIPGATVSATFGGVKIVTTTDENGAYDFPDLAPGTWAITVDMLGFAKLSRSLEITNTAQAPSPDWDLRLLSAQALNQEIAAASHPPAAPGSATSPNRAAGTGGSTTSSAPTAARRAVRRPRHRPLPPPRAPPLRRKLRGQEMAHARMPSKVRSEETEVRNRPTRADPLCGKQPLASNRDTSRWM